MSGGKREERGRKLALEHERGGCSAAVNQFEMNVFSIIKRKIRFFLVLCIRRSLSL